MAATVPNSAADADAVAAADSISSPDTSASAGDAHSLGPAAADVLDSPFGHVDGLSRPDVREAAYEVFFMSCRAGGTNGKGAGNGNGALSHHPAPWDSGGGGGGDESPRIGAGPRGGTGMNVVNSRVKRALGLKARRSSQPSTALRSGMNTSSSSSAPGSPGRAVRAMMNQPSGTGSPRARRPMTSAEIMRQQMRVSEQSDARLRKTLMRTLVGQVRPSIHARSPMTRKLHEMHMFDLRCDVMLAMQCRWEEERRRSSCPWSCCGS
jgi:hypothetical protein